MRVELKHEGSGRQSASWHVILARALRLNTEWVLLMLFLFFSTFSGGEGNVFIESFIEGF